MTDSLSPATSDTLTVLAEVAKERARQEWKWGGSAHDDEHGFQDWARFRAKFERRIEDEAFKVSPFVPKRWRMLTRESLIKIAALCVAQIESLDRGSQSEAKQ